MLQNKGVILCGGKGTRLAPATKVVNKHLIPIISVPMVLFPLQTLKQVFGITDILLISGGENIGGFAEFLGDGSEYGVDLTYKVQKEANGIAGALVLAEDFVGGGNFVTILGDNIFDFSEGDAEMISTTLQRDTFYGPALFVTDKVDDMTRFGVLNASDSEIIEKPSRNRLSNHSRAVTGLYIYDSSVFDFIRHMEPSSRGELEVTDINNNLLRKEVKPLIFELGVGTFWSDAGTPESLVKTIQHYSEYLSTDK